MSAGTPVLEVRGATKSFGERQVLRGIDLAVTEHRVAIARAFAGRPRALLLDEVTSALDPELVGEVLAAVRDLKAEGMTMVIATHEMSFAREVADQVAFLHDGRIVESGPPQKVLEAPEGEETKRFLRRLLEAGRI
jgi:polar amino acid transport system ATP-binding protein